ncbi:hypothetical protein M409DRAFT_53942 [Zasmidium cellare ATCC 36951]|uniref:Uncharacterized protein n=1 Tax=Zasmidium cellare ATCC 36951 TaxID=1080233 RepID=A0A6A6CJK4_ZASCE|nr:uncharacterized protein M409DRAFT_53942 [Zasmidium cellare ATCC 36951]KAF2167335.1 hypothetical protein M409DRAFT_53942 [Zasmidium cellare ATCC 36951]
MPAQSKDQNGISSPPPSTPQFTNSNDIQHVSAVVPSLTATAGPAQNNSGGANGVEPQWKGGFVAGVLEKCDPKLQNGRRRILPVLAPKGFIPALEPPTPAPQPPGARELLTSEACQLLHPRQRYPQYERLPDDWLPPIRLPQQQAALQVPGEYPLPSAQDGKPTQVRPRAKPATIPVHIFQARAANASATPASTVAAMGFGRIDLEGGYSGLAQRQAVATGKTAEDISLQKAEEKH